VHWHPDGPEQHALLLSSNMRWTSRTDVRSEEVFAGYRGAGRDLFDSRDSGRREEDR